MSTGEATTLPATVRSHADAFAAGRSAGLETALAKHQKGHTEEAETAYLELLAQAPEDRQARFYLGTLYLGEKRFADAVQAFESIRDRYPADVAMLWSLAEAYKGLGELPDARMTYKELISHKPETAAACLNYAERFLKLNEIDYAHSFLQKTVALSKSDNGIRPRVATVCQQARLKFLRAGKLLDAIAVLRLELELNPRELPLYQAICQLLGDAGCLNEARLALKTLTNMIARVSNPNQLAGIECIDDITFHRERELWSNLPNADDVHSLKSAYRLKCYSLAQSLCNDLIQTFPDVAEFRYIAAKILHRISNAARTRSAELLHTLERSFKDEASYCFDLATVFGDSGNHAAAAIWLHRALSQSNAPDPQILHQLGRAKKALGRHAEAAAHLLQAIEIKADLYEAYFDIHDTLLAEEKFEDALTVFDKALRTNALSTLRGVTVHPGLMSGTANFIATQQNAVDRGIPPIVLNSLGNSGSTYIMLRLVAGLRIPAHSFLLGRYSVWDDPIPGAVENMAKGGAICRQHFYATPEILAEFRRCRITDMVLQIRDPRQLALSNLHYMEMLYSSGSYIPERTRQNLPGDYFERTRPEKLDYLIDNFIPRDTGMIQSWIDAQKEWPSLRVHYCDYESMVTDPDTFLREILDFYGIPPAVFNWSADVEMDDAHFRKGETDEWRRVFSEDQKRRAWELIPEDLRQRFNWRE